LPEQIFCLNRNQQAVYQRGLSTGKTNGN